MTELQIREGQKLIERRDRANTLANRVYNYGLHISPSEIEEIAKQLSADDYNLIRELMTETMKKVADKATADLENL